MTKAEAHVDYNHYIYFEVRALRNGVASGWSLPASISPGPIIAGFYGAYYTSLLPGGFPNGAKGNPSVPGTAGLPTSDREVNRIYSILVDAGYETKFFQAVNGRYPAEDWLLKNLDTGKIKDGIYDPNNTNSNIRDVARTIEIFGYSWGGTTGVKLSQTIQDSFRFVNKTVQVLAVVDPVTLFLNAPPFDLPGPITVPGNVNFFDDWYQTNPSGNGGIESNDTFPFSSALNLPRRCSAFTT